MIYFIFLASLHRSLVISPIIGETGRSFSFGINSGSSDIWSDKLKVLYNRHTESRRFRQHKERRRCSVQILDNYLGINALYIKC